MIVAEPIVVEGRRMQPFQYEEWRWQVMLADFHRELAQQKPMERPVDMRRNPKARGSRERPRPQRT